MAKIPGRGKSQSRIQPRLNPIPVRSRFPEAYLGADVTLGVNWVPTFGKKTVPQPDSARTRRCLSIVGQLPQQIPHFPNSLCVCRIAREVLQLEWIARRVQEHCAGSTFVPFHVVPALGTYGST